MPARPSPGALGVAGVVVTAPVLGIGIILALAVFGLNWFGVSVGAVVQVVLFAVMIVIGVALFGTALLAGEPGNIWPMWSPGQDPVTSTARMVVPGITYVVGFSLVAVLAEESTLPPRRVGRTVIAVVVISAAFYTMVLVATALIVPWADVAHMELGTIDAFAAAGYPLLSAGAFVIAAFGLVTSFIGLFVACSRVVLAMARARLLPPALAVIHEPTGVPRRALVMVLVATVVPGMLGPGAIVWFLDAGGVFLGVVWLLVVAAKYRLPRVRPDVDRPYRARPAWLPTVGAAGAAAVILAALVPVPGVDMTLQWPAEYLVLAGWAVLGIAVYAMSLAGIGSVNRG